MWAIIEFILILIQLALAAWVAAGVLAWVLFIPLLFKRREEFGAWAFHLTLGILFFSGLGGAFLFDIIEELRDGKAGADFSNDEIVKLEQQLREQWAIVESCKQRGDYVAAGIESGKAETIQATISAIRSADRTA